MTRTAKRRWSRELESQIDGLALAATGPVVLHGYDEPAGGKWVDSVIPGKLGALDRHTGEPLWWVPCEVGYGRGFAAGVVSDERIVVLGPALSGASIITHVALADGQVQDVREIGQFDEGLVAADLCHCMARDRLFAVDTHAREVTWTYSGEGERYHHIARTGDRLLAVVSRKDEEGQGVIQLDAETGEFEGTIVPLGVPVIHDMVADDGTIVLLTADLARILPDSAKSRLAVALAEHPDEGIEDTLSLVALRHGGGVDAEPRWLEVLATRPVDDLPEASIQMDAGKLYIEQGAHLRARDLLTGRELGEWTVPGLDERLAWTVVQGAGLLAEETRVSIFELPA